ncbi:hypothetical protein [Dyadobacter sandarakinus]|uniref:Uncharacterized protein n=1 Tax=Dyadobacter sandarakinus TaxID=2747268 RepID=A0ABX7I4C6_9BACT|nr:hypothetical protein [Dyadobacter sandarakinus]QRR00720.1 hypothetical protein HWI92_07280 [Dyadobacter sandarakinus]
MPAQNDLKKNYKMLLDWYGYRARENAGSLKKLQKLLAVLNRDVEGGKVYDKDIDDLESLKFIYETGIRNFESQVEKYQALLDELS